MTMASGPSPQETVERALAAAKSDDCVVIAEETSTANLRWAGNTLTTNGVAGSRQLTIIAIDRRGEGAPPRGGFPGRGPAPPNRGRGPGPEKTTPETPHQPNIECGLFFV